MRNGQNKRMRGRNNRSKSHHHHNPLTRVYESNGPDVKIRGTAHHVAEKYLQLARDATSSGDPVTAENYFQHAEHYLRLIAGAQDQLRQQNPYYQQQSAGSGEDRGEQTYEESDDEDQPIQVEPAIAVSQPQYQPRNQPQPYGGPQPNQDMRAPRPAQVQPMPQPHPPQQGDAEPVDADQLPAFITGNPQPQAVNGHDDSAASDRYANRRRRYRSSSSRSSGQRSEQPNPESRGGHADNTD